MKRYLLPLAVTAQLILSSYAVKAEDLPPKHCLDKKLHIDESVQQSYKQLTVDLRTSESSLFSIMLKLEGRELFHYMPLGGGYSGENRETFKNSKDEMKPSSCKLIKSLNEGYLCTNFSRNYGGEEVLKLHIIPYNGRFTISTDIKTGRYCK